MTRATPVLFVFGLGYSGLAIARAARARGWPVGGTVRTADKAEALRGEGIGAVVFDGTAPGAEVADRLAQATHVLSSIAPAKGRSSDGLASNDPGSKDAPGAGDPVLAHHGGDIAAAPGLAWLGYLSTIGVYGDAGGAWIDETAPPDLALARAARRVAAEAGWRDMAAARAVPALVLRLGGIYGPGRSPLDALREGRARRIVKRAQVFNRIHVEDIAAIALAAMTADLHGLHVLNGVDDLPAPPQDVIAFAADLLRLAPPPEVPFETADLSPMGRQFYGANRRVSNAALKRTLGTVLRHPTYRDGLRAVRAAERAGAASP